MATQVDTKIAEAQIHHLMDDWARAARDKDIDGIMACYTPDIVSFDMIPPLQYVGAEAYRKDWQMGFEMCQEPGDFETRDETLAVGADVAFCHRLNRMSGTDEEGNAFDCWVRWTQCFKKVHGKWLIAHEHISVPLDMQTNQALTDLKP